MATVIIIRALEVVFSALCFFIAVKIVDRPNKANTFGAALGVFFVIHLARLVPVIGPLAGLAVWIAVVFGVFELNWKKAIGLIFAQFFTAIALAIPFAIVIMLLTGGHPRPEMF